MYVILLLDFVHIDYSALNAVTLMSLWRFYLGRIVIVRVTLSDLMFMFPITFTHIFPGSDSITFSQNPKALFDEYLHFRIHTKKLLEQLFNKLEENNKYSSSLEKDIEALHKGEWLADKLSLVDSNFTARSDRWMHW